MRARESLSWTRWLTPLPLILLTVSGAGAQEAERSEDPAEAGDPYLALESFSDVIYFIQQNYVDDIEAEALIHDAIRGMTDGLDMGTSYMSPDEYRRFREDTIGRYYGIGIITHATAEAVLIDKVFEESPAQRAGLLVGDRITTVDGVRITEENVEVVMGGIKGPRGTFVRLVVHREDVDDTIHVEIPRDRIRTPSVESERLPRDVGWIRVFQFQENTGREVRRALAALEKRDGPLQGLILDLRLNPGGYLDEAVEVTDVFLDEGVIVTTRGRAVQEATENAHQPGSRVELPLVILQNHGSASAAEIVAGALQDQQRATIVGTTSFGKGSVQTTYEFTDGSALKLTIARYYTPNGRSIHGTGIKPDIRVLPSGDVEIGDEAPTSDPFGVDLTEMPEWVQEDATVATAVQILLDDSPAEP